MMKQFGLVGVAALAAIAAFPCAAHAAKGYRASYVAERDHYCVRPVTLSEAERLGIAVHKTECRSAAAWAAMGIKVSRG